MRRGKIFGKILAIALVGLILGATFAILPSTSNITYAYPNTPFKDVFADAPWRVELGQDIPILVMIKDAGDAILDYDIGDIEIYWDIDCDGNDNEDNDILLKTETKWNGHRISYSSGGNMYNPGDWYGITYLDPSEHGLSGEVWLHVVIRENDWNPLDPDGDAHSHFIVNIASNPLPALPNWYPGDIHYHSYYTDNVIEYGAPIEAIVEAGKRIGLQWNVITDHSFDVRDTKISGYPNDKWNDLKSKVIASNAASPYKLILGEEVSCYGKDGAVHLLVLGMEDFHDVWEGLDFIPGYRDELDSPTLELEEVIDIVNSQNGVSYAAHPGTLPSLVEQLFLDRALWAQEDYDLLGYHGLQWKEDRTVGLENWVNLLLAGRKVFIGGGSDAHGDFSHTQADQTDNAFGKVRTYVYCENLNEEEILEALKNGHSIMTNGPVVVFDITNEKGEEAIIGHTISGNQFMLNIQWESTNEFGKVEEIQIWQGIVGETSERILKTLSPNGLSGTETLDISDEIPQDKTSYIRIYAKTQVLINPWGYAEYHEAFTNPIWVSIGPSQNDMGSGIDAGNTIDQALAIPTPASGTGYLDSTDTSDFYKFYVSAPAEIDILMTPPSGSDFDIKLYDPDQNPVTWPRLGDSQTETIRYEATESGWWYLEVWRYSGSGSYSLSVSVVSAPSQDDMGSGTDADGTIATFTTEAAPLPFWIWIAVGAGGAFIVGVVTWRLLARRRA